MKKITLFLLSQIFILSVLAQDVPRNAGNLKLLPVLFHQQAAEYTALCYQAFNFATDNLNAMKFKRKKHYAIITDVDETILDNSYHEAEQIVEGNEFSAATWKTWTSKASATPVPGAVEFLQLAASKKVEIFYISNRDTTEVANTIANLKKYNCPNADEEHMLFLKDKSSKEERRLRVAKDFTVMMLLGDNLNDFMQVFEKRNSTDRKAEAQKIRTDWGHKFIVIPNSIYGEWENALYDYQRALSPEQKAVKLREKLMIVPR